MCAAAMMVAMSLAAGAGAGVLSAPAGYVCVDTVLDMPVGAWFGGFDALPNGNFVVADGYSIREIAPSGAAVQTLYTYPGYVYGSFVKYNPGNDRVYFGETSTGSVLSVPSAGGAAAAVTTLAYNYDLDFFGDKLYAVAGNAIYLVDEITGATDLIASAGIVSGPVIFDVEGNMIYGTGNPNWPPTTNDQSIYKWSAAQVAGAVGAGVLTEADAVVIGANVDAPGGFAFDGLGRLVYSDSQVSPGVLRILGVDEPLAVSQVEGASPWITTVRRNPADGSISAAVSWFGADWSSTTVISTLVYDPVLAPEPSSVMGLCSLLGLAASSKLLRRRGR